MGVSIARGGGRRRERTPFGRAIRRRREPARGGWWRHRQDVGLDHDRHRPDDHGAVGGRVVAGGHAAALFEVVVDRPADPAGVEDIGAHGGTIFAGSRPSRGIGTGFGAAPSGRVAGPVATRASIVRQAWACWGFGDASRARGSPGPSPSSCPASPTRRVSSAVRAHSGTEMGSGLGSGRSSASRHPFGSHRVRTGNRPGPAAARATAWAPKGDGPGPSQCGSRRRSSRSRRSGSGREASVY